MIEKRSKKPRQERVPYALENPNLSNKMCCFKLFHTHQRALALVL